MELGADHLQTPSSRRTGDLLLLYGLSVRDVWDLFKGSETIDGETTCHPQIPVTQFRLGTHQLPFVWATLAMPCASVDLVEEKSERWLRKE